VLVAALQECEEQEYSERWGVEKVGCGANEEMFDAYM
jgi:hypothetical protein